MSVGPDQRPTSRSRTPVLSRLLAAIVVAVVLAGGVFVLGRIAPTEIIAMGLTAAWFAVVALLATVVWRRRRDLLVPLAVGYGLVAIAAGLYLGLPQVTDNTVNEKVTTGSAASNAGAGGNVNVAQGTFGPKAHSTEGTASIVKLADGSHRLTLTGFATDNGPDLRVYLVPAASGDSVNGAVDLGKLKGNRGAQEYTLPANADPASFGQVVIWCRAFSVSFGAATLAAA